MKPLAKWLGGSKMYGMSTSQSDIDEREIFIHTDPKYIVGLNRFDQQVINDDKQDVARHEVRYFLHGN